jgi:hypothetical protein
MRAEDVAALFEILSQFAEIKDLSIEDQRRGSVAAVHRLIAGHKVYDRQAAVAKAKARLEMKAIAIRTTMRDRVGHLPDHFLVWWPRSAEIKPAGYPAHQRSL